MGKPNEKRETRKKAGVKAKRMSGILKCCKKAKQPKQTGGFSDLIGRKIRIEWTDKVYYDAFVANFDQDKGELTVFYPGDRVQSSEVLSEEVFLEIGWSVYPKVSRKQFTKYPPGTFIVVADRDGNRSTGMVYDDAPKGEAGKLAVYIVAERRALMVSKGRFKVVAQSVMVE